MVDWSTEGGLDRKEQRRAPWNRQRLHHARTTENALVVKVQTADRVSGGGDPDDSDPSVEDFSDPGDFTTGTGMTSTIMRTLRTIIMITVGNNQNTCSGNSAAGALSIQESI